MVIQSLNPTTCILLSLTSRFNYSFSSTSPAFPMPKASKVYRNILSNNSSTPSGSNTIMLSFSININHAWIYSSSSTSPTFPMPKASKVYRNILANNSSTASGSNILIIIFSINLRPLLVSTFCKVSSFYKSKIPLEFIPSPPPQTPHATMLSTTVPLLADWL